VVTTRADGRPHASPVWGLFIDNAVWWSTSPDSVKGRNLARDPRVLIHLESGDNVVVIEGIAQRLDGEEEFVRRFIEAYEKKYDFRPTAKFLKGQTYRLLPTVGLSWAEKTFETNKVRWKWPSASQGQQLIR
jgi:PPOX class probable F420-dependent enzyme